jgi:hypothetical protein
MATTTQRQIYAGILTDLHASADSVEAGSISVHKNYIYITPIPLYSQSDAQIIQLIPGVPTVETDMAGIGYVEEDFRIAVWARCYLDQVSRSTEKVTNATYGVLKTIDEVRQAMIQSDANETASVPARWVSGSSPVESDEAIGWVYYEDTYRIGYEITWS